MTIYDAINFAMQSAVYVYRTYTTTGSDQLNTKLLVLQAHGKNILNILQNPILEL